MFRPHALSILPDVKLLEEEQAPIPTVVTDKPDYAPGATAIITASGFEPGSTLRFDIQVSMGALKRIAFWAPNDSLVGWAPPTKIQISQQRQRTSRNQRPLCRAHPTKTLLHRRSAQLMLIVVFMKINTDFFDIFSGV